ncbi:MAG TPA: M6 family metalloprotease domain-containing protein [Longimicrobiales bacterium]|nr:M6 family metalloprotease domain-containing protein [Longimicrobiales bacterium]
MLRPSALLAMACAALAGGAARPAAGQDVELLSRHYGTPLPDGYHRTRAAFPRAFEFGTGRAVRLGERLRQLETVRAEAVRVGPSAALGARDDVVEGTFHIPLVLGLYSNSPPGAVPFTREGIHEAYFGSGNATIRAYYDEVSGGRVKLGADVSDWVRSSLSDTAATAGQSGLTVGSTGAFIVDLLRKLPPGIDWGAYDNDGPDAIPNSGDDDGYVDVLAVLQPGQGAECGTTNRNYRIWSHRWALRYASREAKDTNGWVTAAPSARGGFIRVDDYVVQPTYACGGSGLNEIGVFTHELGHAFGLPDLYDTLEDNGKHQGAGNWDLMATGSWGCNGQSPDFPCHLGAWSKMVMGWADVRTLPQDTDLGTLTLPAVETSGRVLRIDAADGSRDFYLLENRQRVGFDGRLYNDGMLVWRVSQDIVDARWSANQVNAHARLGVWIREADGLNELATPGCPRGNAGDTYPFVGPLRGCNNQVADGENRVFHAASAPSSVTDAGKPSGLTLTDIRKEAGVVSFRASTRFTRMAVRSEGDAGKGGLFTVNGAPMAEALATYRSAPFSSFSVAAAAGESLGPGVRRPFTGWKDDPAAARGRTLVTPLQDVELVARYAGEQVELAVELKGGQGDVAPGTLVTQPAAADLWFAPGTSLTVQAQARKGFGFLRWGGALAGRPNPTTLTLTGPVQAAAEFELTYRVAATTVRVRAAEDPLITLEPENGTPPYTWKVVSGTLPEGLSLNLVGQLFGAAMETGAFPLGVEVGDGIGLTARGDLVLQVDDATIPAANLASKFLLAGPALTSVQSAYLDRRGNGDGNYDLGDFRAWVLAHPGLALSAPMRALAAPRKVVVPVLPVGKPEVQR